MAAPSPDRAGSRCLPPVVGSVAARRLTPWPPSAPATVTGMTPTDPDRPGRARDGVLAEVGRGLLDGLVEIAVIGLVVLAAVGVGGGLGYLIGGGWGAALGGLVAVGALAVVRVVLVLAGVRMLARGARARTR